MPYVFLFKQLAWALIGLLLVLAGVLAMAGAAGRPLDSVSTIRAWRYRYEAERCDAASARSRICSAR